MGRKTLEKRKEDFIRKANEKHNFKYDYSKVEYINNNTKVYIICPIHGEFLQTPSGHLTTNGCAKCYYDIIGNRFKSNTEKFIEKAKKIHGDRYDYSLVQYTGKENKVCIICLIHGEFYQTPHNHLLNHGCSKCSGNFNYTTQDFIIKANGKHNNKYDYSKVEYIDAKTPVCIICSEHGEFYQSPDVHLRPNGCPTCAGKNKTTQSLICEFIKIHGDKYDYSKVEYVKARSKIKIICPDHGEFTQTPGHHITLKHGCPKCGGTCQSNTDDFIKKAKKIHGSKYDYSKVEYIKNDVKVCIICPIHGEFLQTPSSHLNKNGCPSCRDSVGEKIIANYLNYNNITYIRQYKFEDCRNKNKLPFDFYLSDYNILIEYDGIQHTKPIDALGGIKSFNATQKNGTIKTLYCINNNIKLIRIPHTEHKKIEEILNEHFNIIMK